MRKLSATGGPIIAVSRYSIYCRLLVPVCIWMLFFQKDDCIVIFVSIVQFLPILFIYIVNFCLRN